MNLNPRVSDVVAMDDYKLKLVFTNGEQGIYDCFPLLEFGVFTELRDKNYFNRVKPWDGTIVWPHEQDICPDTLYLDSEKSKPLVIAEESVPYGTDISALIQYCKNNIDIAEIKLSSEYGYDNIPLCVIDAVFSIGVRYTSTQNTVARFRKFHKDKNPESDSELAISEFINIYHEYDLNYMTEQVYQNKQRTSTRNGILKAEAVLRFSNVLAKFDIEHLHDIPEIIGNNDFELAIKKIPGQGSGISLRYFYMLSGSEDFIKPDRMINRFVKQATGKSFGIEDTTKLLRETCKVLMEDYPELTPRALDNAIWQYQRV